jgi:hypothetical protein
VKQFIKFENKTNGRWYYIQIQRDIFNELGLYIRRGGRNASVGWLVFCGSYREVYSKIREITQRRLQRGYILVD